MSIHSMNPLILTHVSNKFNPSTKQKNIPPTPKQINKQNLKLQRTESVPT